MWESSHLLPVHTRIVEIQTPIQIIKMEILEFNSMKTYGCFWFINPRKNYALLALDQQIEFLP